MKTKIFIIICIIGIYSSTNAQNLFDPTKFGKEKYEQEWKTVEKFDEERLPKSALNIAENIYIQAKKENNPSQQIKALIHILKYRARFEEYSMKKSIKFIEEELNQTSFPTKNLLYSFLADFYKSYYNNNRWKILNRTNLKYNKSHDIATWGVDKFGEKIINLQLKSLEEPDLLKQVKNDFFKDIMFHYKDAEEEQQIRPTLYDFLLHKTINKLKTNELRLTKPKEEFLLSPTKYMTSIADFANLKIETPDSFSHQFLTILNYQKLIKFHLSDEKPDALVINYLDFLNYLKNNTNFKGKNDKYYSLLKKISKIYENDPIVADINFHIAELIHQDYRPDEYANSPLSNNKIAINICDKTLIKFPKAFGSKNCRYLKNIILTKEYNLKAESTIPAQAESKIYLKYKNIDKITLRIVLFDKEGEKKWQKTKNKREKLNLINKLSPIFEQTYNLKLPEDHNFHSTYIHIPKLNYGKYLFMASPSSSFSNNNNKIEYGFFQITNLSLIERYNQYADQKELSILNAKTGKPIENAEIITFRERWNKTKKSYEEKQEDQYFTNKTGKVLISNAKNQNLRLRIIKGKDIFSPNITVSFYKNRKQPPKLQTKTFYFTDRSIYRPGQIVHFKGIMISQLEDSSKLLANKAVKVVLKDVNYQEIAKLDLLTNEYGSFSGSFTIPTNLLNGQMTISSDNGRTYISVEEYKRPKFEVNIEKPEGTYKLEDQITLKGNAQTYSKLALSDAQVKYTVKRVISYPYWYRWWMPRPKKTEKEITHGTLQTNAKGKFEIKFIAEAPKNIIETNNPIFSYEVNVRVVDITGETHSAQTTVRVGFSSLSATLTLPDKIDKYDSLKFMINTYNLNGKQVETTGEFKIEKLKPKERILRSRLLPKVNQHLMSKQEFVKLYPFDIYDNENILGEKNVEKEFFKKNLKSNQEITIENMKEYPQGTYRISFVAEDKFGKKVTTQKIITIFDKKSQKNMKNEFAYYLPIKTHCKVGEKAQFLIGSAAKDVEFYFKIEHKDNLIKEQIIKLNKSQKLIEIPILEKYRGGLKYHLYMIKENRFYNFTEHVYVPWTNKKLNLKLETYRNVMKPGKKEEWKIKVTDQNEKGQISELLANMYDESLDAFKKHSWQMSIFSHSFSGYRYTVRGSFNSNSVQNISWNWWKRNTKSSRNFDYFLNYGFNFNTNNYYMSMSECSITGKGIRRRGKIQSEVQNYATEEFESEKLLADSEDKNINKDEDSSYDTQDKEENHEEVKIRKNLQENVFFYPHLKTNEKGEVIFSFESSEALSRWKFMAFAHTKDLKLGQTSTTVITQKELMVQPNPPRFLRTGDQINFATKLSNISGKQLSGDISLKIFDAFSMKEITANFCEENNIKKYTIKDKENQVYKWKLKTPDKYEAIVYKVVATSTNHNDGEENSFAILPNKMLVTESMPLPVRAGQSKEFKFKKLINQNKGSKTLKNYNLSLEMTSNPAWYAIQALPYLMEYPYQCAEQTFNRFYSNSISSHLVNSDGKIKQVFESWKKSENSLKSNLQKNEKLKALLLQESPWVLKAQDQTKNKYRVSLLFEKNNLEKSLRKSITKLSQMQKSNGAFPWFEGMRENRFITQYIVSGFGHLEKLNIKTYNQQLYNQIIQRAIKFLDNKMKKDYDYLIKNNVKLSENNLNYLIVQYLYARSFFFQKYPISDKFKKEFDYWQLQAKKYWKDKNLMSQAMIALALDRLGEDKTNIDILMSIKEHSLNTEEMGMYWKSNSYSYFWHSAPIETQAILIEAFDEITNDNKAVEDMKVWLLKQKQVQDWKTTKATADACYALLLRGENLLKNDKLVDVYLNNKKFDIRKEDGKVEKGTGYYKHNWKKEAIKPEYGNVKVSNSNSVVAWGALHWQYFEELDKITSHKTPLSLDKKVYIKRDTDKGEILEELKENVELNVGDLLKIRIKLSVDRDMEFVHMKDMRAAALEPTEAISGYRYRGGLGFYQSFKDASVNFFFSYLPKGTYIFEYPLTVTQEGDFQNGITSIQSMYAPEFNSHSEGIKITIKEK